MVNHEQTAPQKSRPAITLRGASALVFLAVGLLKGIDIAEARLPGQEKPPTVHLAQPESMKLDMVCKSQEKITETLQAQTIALERIAARLERP